MIGVATKPEELPAVEEFFELFKTPWEIFRCGEDYDVVISTMGRLPETSARLIILYDSRLQPGEGADCKARPMRTPIALNHRGLTVPLYGNALVFDGPSGSAAGFSNRSEIFAVWIQSADSRVLRVGYDLFAEIRLLLTVGQPVANARIPALEIHIAMLRHWILEAGLSLVEIPPVPSGHGFTVCLTHDIDFIGIRRHKLDHTMWGFLWRATFGATREFVRRRLAFSRLLRAWQSAVTLPLVYLGWARDFWEPFEWYLQVERGLPATYFLIPFKHRTGGKVSAKHVKRRACAYDISDLGDWTAKLMDRGCEIGVHGIDAWQDTELGGKELVRITAVTGEPSPGIRMHWLLQDAQTPCVLEKAGYGYDSSAGYNETVGYRNGTSQPFRPPGTRTLIELPLHIQDGALFFAQRLNLSAAGADAICRDMVGQVQEFGGVLTVLWHDRSHAPERFWGDFYSHLIMMLKSTNAWFAGGAQAVAWFQKRRAVCFERGTGGAIVVRLRPCGGQITPPLRLRTHVPCDGRPRSDASPMVFDSPWTGDDPVLIAPPIGVPHDSSPEPAICTTP